MKRFIVMVEGPNLNDVGEIELPRLPGEGEPIETRFGTLIVTSTEVLTGHASYQGKIVCKLS